MSEEIQLVGSEGRIIRNDAFAQLLNAVLNKNVHNVHQFLAQGIDPNDRHIGYNIRLLHVAVLLGSREIVQQLLLFGATPNIPDSFGISPQQRAEQLGRHEVTSTLARADAAGSIPYRHVSSPLSSYASVLNAIMNANLVELDRFLKQNDFNICEVLGYGLTLLHIAVLVGNIDIIHRLLYAGASVLLNRLDDFSYSPLTRAIKIKHFEIARILISAGTHVNDLTLLFAVVIGADEIIGDLIDTGLNVNTVNNEGKSFLHFAVEFQHPKVIRALLAKGADYEMRDNDHCSAQELAQQIGNQEIIGIFNTAIFIHFLQSNHGSLSQNSVFHPNLRSYENQQRALQ